MNDTDSGSGSNCNNTRISCALNGVRILLQSLSPCLASQTTCGTVTGGNVSNSVDRVSMFVFPPVTTATVADDYNCGSTNPTITSYATPFPSTSTYQIIPFSSDYRTSDTASSLRTTSHLGAAVVGTSGTPCLKAVGGEGTYYAQAIYAAQAALVTEQSSVSECEERDDHPQRRRFKRDVGTHARGFDDDGHIHLNAAAVPSGDHRGAGCCERGDPGVYGRLRPGSFWLRDRHDSVDHTVSDHGAYGVELGVFLLRLCGDRRHQHLHLRVTAGYQPEPDLSGDRGRSDCREADSQRDDIDGRGRFRSDGLAAGQSLVLGDGEHRAPRVHFG